MTGWYVYAIIDQPHVGPLAGPGVGGGVLASVPYRDIAAVVSPVEDEEIPILPAHVRHHEAIVEALMAVAVVLPVRFGTLVPDQERLRALLADNYRSFTASLARVRGRVELGLRVLWTDGVDPAPPRLDRPRPPSTLSGREYLMARLGEERRTQARCQRAQDLADELHRPLAELVHASTWQVLRTPRLLLSAAYLVDTPGVGRVRDAVGSLAQTHGQLQFLLTGPWPPYHFVTADDPVAVAPEAGGARANVLA